MTKENEDKIFRILKRCSYEELRDKLVGQKSRVDVLEQNGWTEQEYLKAWYTHFWETIKNDIQQ